VFNPDTGSYELRLQPAPPRPRRPQEPFHGDPYQQQPAPDPYQQQPAPGPYQQPDGYGRPREPRLPGQRPAATPEPEPEDDFDGRPSRRKPKPPKSGRRKALMWTGAVMGVVLIAGSAGAYYVWQHLNGNIDQVDVAGADNAATTDGPVNILIIGTDKRSGKGNEGYGDKGSIGHADTNLLFHVSKDRTNATVLSIPRDLITDIPDCQTKKKDGSVKDIPGTSSQRFNTSLGQYGRDPGCTMATVKQLTGVPKINHFMMADFNAVKELSTAVGGVDVCLAKPINDEKSKLNLPAGHHTVKGEDALAFVRTRHSVGFGSDLSRIQLQQQFIGSLVRKMKSGDTLTNPKKLLDVANAATKSLTVDTGIGSVQKLISLAKDLKKVPQKNITFVTLPVVDNPAEKVHATVVLDKPKAEPIFKMLQADKSMTAAKKRAKTPVKRAPAAQVRVDVMNGGAPPGSAQETLDWLQNSKGMPLSTNSGNAQVQLAKTKLEYAPNQAGQAATLAAVMGLPRTALKVTTAEAGPRDPMKLTLGKDFTEAGTPIAAPDRAPAGVQHVSADDKNLCAK
jgi:LCP family protein required for cell wall assembly